MTRFCTKCGGEITPGSKFCNTCGNPVENDFEENRPIPIQSTPVFPKKSTGNNNRLIMALAIAVLLIGGIGGYLFFGRSSGDKNTAAKPQPNPAKQAEQAAKPADNVPTPKPAPVVKQDNARNAFIGFHTAITNRQMGEAFNILSPSYQHFMKSYDNFVRGYATTLRSDVVELNTVQENSNSATLTYKLRAVDREGTGEKTQYFIGKAQLIKINGKWRIDRTEAKRASQDSTAAGYVPANPSKYSIKSGSYPVFLNGDPNYIIVDGQMGNAWYLARNSISIKQTSPDDWNISCDIVSATETGQVSPGGPRRYEFYFNERNRTAGVVNAKGLRYFSYSGPRSETMVINGAGAMVYYIATGKMWPEFGFSRDTYSYADL